MDAKLLRKPFDGAKREVPLPPFHGTHEGPMPSDVLAKGFLGVAHLSPEPP